MREIYANNIQSLQADIAILQKKINTNSLLRLAIILIGGAWLFQVFQWNNVWILFVSIFVILLSFVALVRRQSIFEKLLLLKEAYLAVNQNEISLIEGQVNMYDSGEQYDDSKHPYVSDLDIFGPHSLFEKLNRSATLDGNQKLASWLLSSSPKGEVIQRQEASEELANKLDWSQTFQSKLLFNLKQKTNIKSFLAHYFADHSFTFGSAFMRIYVLIAPYLLLVAVLCSIFVTALWSYIGIACLVHLFWTMGLAGKVSYFSNRIDKVGVTLLAYSDAIKMVEEESFTTARNQSLQNQLKTEKGETFSSIFKKLGSLVEKLDARNNILVGAVLNMLFLWDFRQVLAIVDWKKNYEGNILESFDTIGEFEALVSLATLRRNNPSWVNPVLLDDHHSERIETIDLNHPLIDPSKAVSNTYTAQDHQVALVTGSNMAGKSTFLRTIGINAVLAYAGAVVFASKFRLPIYRLVTYMRIKDNLNESTSTFKAEIDRMRFILGLVDVAKDSYFLIDEMLRGTNSVDKYLGSKAIIKKLIQMNGKGMVATHDLQLASLENDYTGVLKNYHFDIQVKDGEMLFDYKLKDGKCTIFNASILLKDIGIDVEKTENSYL